MKKNYIVIAIVIIIIICLTDAKPWRGTSNDRTNSTTGNLDFGDNGYNGDIHDSDDIMYECPRCGGSGECRVCRGRGTYTSFNGEVKDCSVCKKDSGVCQTCKGIGAVSQQTYDRINNINEAEYKEKIEDENKYKCSWCNGSGICRECNGSGKNDASDIMAGWGCQLCEGKGKCYKCGGDGMASY